MRKILRVRIIILSLITIILSGCVSLTITQELDLTPDNKLIISAKVSGDSDIRTINDAVKEINCKFEAEESKRDYETYLIYTSEDCILKGVSIKQLNKELYRYSFDSSSLAKYSSEITEATYLIRMTGDIVDTNGITVGTSQVKFVISSEDIKNKYVYYVDYNLYCKYDSECASNEACIKSECTKLNCDACQYLEDHQCKSYECCADRDCSSSENCEEHTCFDLKCEYNEHPENHICIWNCVDNSVCDWNKECKDHSCNELSCDGFFKKASNHQCVNDYATISILIVFGLLVLGIIIYPYHKFIRKKIRKANRK